MPVTSRIGAEIRQRQAGADADFEDALARPVVGDAHRVLAAGMKDRTEHEIVGAGEQAIGSERVLQVHSLRPLGTRRHRSRALDTRRTATSSALVQPAIAAGTPLRAADRRSDQRDAIGLEPLAAVDDVDAHALARAERLDAAAAQRGDMDEHVLAAAIGRDEAVALLGLEPFDRALERLSPAAADAALARRAPPAATAVLLSMLSTVTTSGPLAPAPISQRDRRAFAHVAHSRRGAATAIGRNASGVPSSIVTKPNPLAALNHFTLASTRAARRSSSVRKKSGRRSNMRPPCARGARKRSTIARTSAHRQHPAPPATACARASSGHLSTSRFWAIHGIMARSFSPTFSMSCSAARRRIALKLAWPAAFSSTHSWAKRPGLDVVEDALHLGLDRGRR